MPTKVVVDDGQLCAKGSRVTFVPAEEGSRTLRMIEDASSPLTFRAAASIRMGDTMLLHVTVKRKKKGSKAKAAR